MPTFPESFSTETHHTVEAFRRAGMAVERDWPHYTLETPRGVVSVVGGERVCGWYGNGITTFEAWFPGEPAPEGWLTADEINQRLEELYQ